MLAAIVKHGLWVKAGKERESHTPHPLCDSPRSTYRVPGRFWWLSIAGTSKAFSDPNYSLLHGSKLSVKSTSRTVLDKWWAGNGAGVSQKEPKRVNSLKCIFEESSSAWQCVFLCSSQPGLCGSHATWRSSLAILISFSETEAAVAECGWRWEQLSDFSNTRL